MTNKEFKEAIKKNSLGDEPIILKYSDNSFLCNNYVDQICKSKNKIRLDISDLSEMDSNEGFFDQESNYIYVYQVDKLTKKIYSDMKGLIVICKEVSSEQDIDFIPVDKIVNWHLEDLMKVRLPGLTEEERLWLCKVTNYDVYRLDKESKKISIFNKANQEIIFNELNNEDGYSDLNPMNIFNFSDAIIKRDYNLIDSLLPYLVICDLDPLALIVILLKKFKQIVALQMNPNATAQSLGMTDKQFWYLKKNPVKTFTYDQLIKNIEFLSSIDYNIKSGNLDLSRESLLDYITINVLR